jgi:hypothetical protein
MEGNKPTKNMCNICANDVPIRRNVVCAACSFSACDTCTSKFLMELADDSPRCMNPTCKKVWTSDFLAENFTPSFYNKEYRNKRATILLERQIALLPGTQHLVQEKKRKEEYESKIKDIEDENIMLKMLLERNKDKIRDLRRELNWGEEKVEKENKHFTRACPRQNCRGFLSTALKCGTCNEWACKDCREPKNGKDDVDHKCDPNTIETIKLLASDTKPCPTCASQIYKQNGCDQMWCTQCKVAFSWNSGRIEKGVVHNPHFYEFQRQNNGGVVPRAQGDVRCGGFPDIYEVLRNVSRLKGTVTSKESDFDHGKVHRLMIHIDRVELPRYPTRIEDNILANMRVDYLLGTLDKTKWFKLLKEKTKKQEKNSDINQILTMFVATMSDIIGNIIICKNLKDLHTYQDTLESLRAYTNIALSKIGYRFGNINPMITHKWDFKSNSKEPINKKSQHKAPLHFQQPPFINLNDYLFDDNDEDEDEDEDE